MDVDVERVEGGYRIFEPGQKGPGMTVTDAWLRNMGLWPLTRLNVEHVIKATMAATGGVVLNPSRRLPRDIGFTPGFKSLPHHETRGRLPRNPAGIAGGRRPRVDAVLWRAAGR